MNGLQSVSISSCKRFRFCPLGTPGRVLPPRLAYSSQSRPPSPIGNTTTGRSERRAPSGVSNSISPLDPNITGLTPFKIYNREGPVEKLLHAIGRRSDGEVWRYFVQICNLELTNRLSASDFSAVLLSLRPRRYVSLLPRHYLDPRGRGQLHSKSYSFREFRWRLNTVMANMQHHGHRLGTLEYCHLLDCARAGEDVKMAEELWVQMARRSDLVLDTWCYNCYLAALAGTVTTDREKRITRWTLMVKRQQLPEGTREIAYRVYNHMLSEGVRPNSMTFDLLILAMARSGDVSGVKRLLYAVWGVSVNGLSEPDNNLVSQPPTCAPDSQVYPTEHTLAAIAMALGSNNDIETAIRVVDHVSRRYKIPITMPVWVGLVNWTYALTRRPSRIMPAHSVLEFWEIMRGPPYNIQPTIEMYDYLVRSLISRQYVSPAEDKMDEAAVLYTNLIRRLFEVEERYDSAVLEDTDESKSAYEELQKELAIARRAVHRHRSMIRRWVELLALGRGMNIEFNRRKVPNIIAKWGHFLGDNVIYYIDSGYIVLTLGAERAWAPSAIRRRKRMWKPLGTGAKEVDYLD